MAVVLSRTKSHNKNTTRLSRFNVLVLPLISILLVLFNLRLTGFVGNPTWTYQEDVISPAFAPPRRFSDNVQLNIDRGLNIINMFSPIHLAGWIYLGEKTRSNEPKEKHLRTQNDASKLSDDDTIAVHLSKINEFTREDFLPFINTTFVLMTHHYLIPTELDLVVAIAGNITGNKYLLQWFSHNMGMYTGGQHYHAKVSPFPLGLKPHLGKAAYRNPVPHFRQVFLETLNNTEANKTNPIFLGYLRQTSPKRAQVPSGPNLDYVPYLRAISKSSYVISPDGDHPDCHRHYEAIGLGAIPITQMDSFLYSHLEESHVIYNNSNWNLTSLVNSELIFPAPKVNQNMIFEEYWMEYSERITGRPLRWYDHLKGEISLMKDLAFLPITNATINGKEN